MQRDEAQLLAWKGSQSPGRRMQIVGTQVIQVLLQMCAKGGVVPPPGGRDQKKVFLGKPPGL